MDESLPVLDPAPLLALADQTGDAAAHRSHTEYLNLLPTRVSAVVGCLGRNDVEASKDAVVSLKVSSVMAGAVRMEHYCRELEETLLPRVCPVPRQFS